MNKEIKDLAYGMTIEVNGVSESYDMDLDYGMTYDSTVLESNDDLGYGMTYKD